MIKPFNKIANSKVKNSPEKKKVEKRKVIVAHSNMLVGVVR
jgi:hypothetical protein